MARGRRSTRRPGTCRSRRRRPRRRRRRSTRRRRPGPRGLRCGTGPSIQPACTCGGCQEVPAEPRSPLQTADAAGPQPREATEQAGAGQRSTASDRVRHGSGIAKGSEELRQGLANVTPLCWQLVHSRACRQGQAAAVACTVLMRRATAELVKLAGRRAHTCCNVAQHEMNPLCPGNDSVRTCERRRRGKDAAGVRRRRGCCGRRACDPRRVRDEHDDRRPSGGPSHLSGCRGLPLSTASPKTLSERFLSGGSCMQHSCTTGAVPKRVMGAAASLQNTSCCCRRSRHGCAAVTGLSWLADDPTCGPRRPRQHGVPTASRLRLTMLAAACPRMRQPRTARGTG